MSDLRGDRVERHRDEGVYVSRIEHDKKGKEKYSSVPPKDEKKLLAATFFSYLKQIFDALSPEKKLAGKVISQQAVIEHLQQFKKLLAQLDGSDLSQSTEYAISLSDCWCQVLEDFDHLEILDRKKQPSTAEFRRMIDMIKNYPEGAEHRLGFYLLQHAGQDWLPFPFIEILAQLHNEGKKDASSSTLSAWAAAIDSLIVNLRKDLPFKGIPPTEGS